MQKIFRFVIPIEAHDQEISIGKILHVGTKPNDRLNVHVWAFTESPALRYFRVYLTGTEIPDDAQYIGTVVMNDGVYHLVERLLLNS